MSTRWRWETTRTPSGSGNDTVIAVFVTNNPIALEHGPVEGKHLHDRLRGVVILGRRGENLHAVLRHE